MEILEQLQNNPLIWFILALCAFVSVYLGRKSIERKTIKAILTSDELITNQQSKISKIKIFFEDKPVNKLTITKLTFWNNSSPTINDTDIITAAPLSVFTKNGEILEISLLKGNDTPNRINVSPIDDTTAKITFDYLDKKEGGIIQIIHTGDIDSINITRKIKGGKVKIMKYSFKFYRNCQYIILLGILLTVTFYEALENISGLLLLLLMIALILSTIILNYRDTYKNYIPKNCKILPFLNALRGKFLMKLDLQTKNKILATSQQLNQI